MAELTLEQLLDLIEQNGGPSGLDLRGKDLRELQAGREQVIERLLAKLREQGHTTLSPAELIQRWEQVGPKISGFPTFWTVLQREGKVTGEPPSWLSTLSLGLNLRGARLSPNDGGRLTILLGADLQHADLGEADLQHAFLWRANLQHADLFGANLQCAILYGAKLQHVQLRGADLQHAALWGADLRHADLEGAHLQHAVLGGADLQHADLEGAHLQHADLGEAKLQHARLRGVEGLEEARLGGADWSQGYRLGEEEYGGFDSGEGVYRRLKQWFSHSGQYDHAGEFHFREMECRRKEAQEKLIGGQWRQVWHLLWLWLFGLSSGYGERPLRTLVGLGLFWLIPAVFYRLFAQVAFPQALYYSASFLVPFSEDELATKLTGWLSTLALAQAFAGYFLLALFLVVLVLKMGHR